MVLRCWPGGGCGGAFCSLGTNRWEAGFLGGVEWAPLPFCEGRVYVYVYGRQLSFLALWEVDDGPVRSGEVLKIRIGVFE